MWGHLWKVRRSEEGRCSWRLAAVSGDSGGLFVTVGEKETWGSAHGAMGWLNLHRPSPAVLDTAFFLLCLLRPPDFLLLVEGNAWDSALELSGI